MFNYEKPFLEIVKFDADDIVLTNGTIPIPSDPNSPMLSEEDDWFANQNNLNSADNQG